LLDQDQRFIASQNLDRFQHTQFEQSPRLEMNSDSLSKLVLESINPDETSLKRSRDVQSIVIES